MDYLIELEESDEDLDIKLQKAERLPIVREGLSFSLKYLMQAHTHGSPPFTIMDVWGAEVPCTGVFLPTDTIGTWAEVKFRMLGYVLVPRLKPVPLPCLRSGRYHRHSIDLTGPRCSGNFKPYLDGLRHAGEMFRTTIGSGSVHEPIKHLRRGVEIQIIAPKVPASRAASASAAISCTELIEVGGYSGGYNGAGNIRRCQMSWDAILPGSLVEIEFYIRASPLANQGGHKIRYELCSVCVVNDTTF